MRMKKKRIIHKRKKKRKKKKRWRRMRKCQVCQKEQNSPMNITAAYITTTTTTK
jgi:hypothetical protein